MLTSNWATFTLSLSATENSVSSLSCLLCLYRMQSHVFLSVLLGFPKPYLIPDLENVMISTFGIFLEITTLWISSY